MGGEFEDIVRAALKGYADQYNPRPVLRKIWRKIRRHRMNENVGDLWTVTVIRAPNDKRVPEDWPIQSMEIQIVAPDTDKAEEIADEIIAAIQKARGVEYALQIDSVY